MMRIVVCVDNSMGMMFNNRRVSKDEAVVRDIMQMVGSDGIIYTSSYSKKMFNEYGFEVSEISEVTGHNEDAYVFVEDVDISEVTDITGSNIEELIIYKWNRDYPSDGFFNINLEEYCLVSSSDFAGKSHEKITKEIYTR